MTDRKKPGWAFWVAVLLSLPVLYVLSFGPACWIADQHLDAVHGVALGYRPIVTAAITGPEPIKRMLRGYAEWFAPPTAFAKDALSPTPEWIPISILDVLYIGR